MTASPSALPPPAADDDRTTRARIRDAALARFAAQGVQATSLRAIAEDVGVSPPLVVHHFGSKDGLRAACDEHVASLIRRGKREAMEAGVQFDMMAALREVEDGPPMLRYLARTLVDGSSHVDDLVDELVDDAVAYMEEGVARGNIKPSEHPRERAVVLTIWQLGALVLHEHIQRLLGADLTEGAEGAIAWGLPAAELLTRGVLHEEMYQRWRETARAYQEQAHEQEER